MSSRASTCETEERLSDMVLAARAGDHAAFSRLYTNHAPRVRRIVADNVHRAPDVDDTVQEVFTRAYARLDTLREPDRFTYWLDSIARRTAIDHRRCRVALRTAIEPVPDDEVPHLEPGPDDLVLIRDELRVLQTAAGQLSNRDSLALHLVGHLGFAPSEVAEALGVSTGAAKVLVHRARQRLRAAMSMPTEPLSGPADRVG